MRNLLRTSAIAVALSRPYPLGGRLLGLLRPSPPRRAMAEDRERRPRLYVLVVDHNGRLRRLMAELFPKPGSTGPRICSECRRRPQDRALARYLLRPSMKAHHGLKI